MWIPIYNPPPPPPYRFIHHWFACCCVKLIWKCFSPSWNLSLRVISQSKYAMSGLPLSGRGRFLNNLATKQPDAALSPHHRFSHGSRSPTLIYNPQRGGSPSINTLTAEHIPLETPHKWHGGVYIYVCVGEVVVVGCDYVGISWKGLFFSCSILFCVKTVKIL